MTTERVDRCIAIALFVGYVGLLLATSSTLGYARDEGFYFHAARAYRGWFDLLLERPFDALRRENVDRFFAVNHEHPAFMKLGFMLAHKVLYEELRVFSEPGTAYRFFGMLVSALGVAVIFAWGARVSGRTAGLVAALSFACMPRVFYHAHLACFDIPIAALLVTTAYAYARSLESNALPWVLLTGLLYGIALNTKHNAWLLPFALGVHSVLLQGRGTLALIRARRSPLPLGFVALVTLGPIVFFVGWPWIWFDTVPRLVEYVQFHREHDYYNMEFLGQTYWKPPLPRAYAWVMTLSTVPLVTLLLFGAGVLVSGTTALRSFVGARRDESRVSLHGVQGSTLLWGLAVLVNYAPWWSSQTPIFGGTKHWMTAYPFLCLIAGRGFSALLSASRDLLSTSTLRAQPIVERGVGPVAAACVLLGPAVMTATSHPWGLTFYTPLVGGAAGAATLGLNRSFWGYTTGVAAEFLNERARPNAAVYLHDTAVPSWEMLRDDGRVRDDLRGTLAIQASDLALYHYEPHMSRVEYQIWMDYGTTTPSFIGSYDGVPVLWVYERRR